MEDGFAGIKILLKFTMDKLFVHSMFILPTKRYDLDAVICHKLHFTYIVGIFAILPTNNVPAAAAARATETTV